MVRDRDMRKKKIITLGLCIVFVALLTVYLGSLSDDQETPPFETSKVYSLPLGENEEVDVRYVAAVDLTGDGWKEILMSYDVYTYEEQMREGTLYFVIRYKEAWMLVFSSDEIGNFQKIWEYGPGLIRQTIATDDFDGDSRLDLVVGRYNIENLEEFPASTTSRVEVLLREDGIFVEVFSSNIPEFLGPGSIVTDDFDGDGRMDFVVSGFTWENGSPYHAYLFHNDGSSGNFTMSPIALREGIVVEDMWKADIDGDGSLDLVIHATDLDSETYSLILLLNNGQGEFEFQELDMSAESMVVDDFTENGYPDIIYGQPGGDLYFLRNEQGEFVEPKLIDILSEGRIMGMISADFNNDNTPDVLLLEESKLDVIGHLLLIDGSAEGELSFTWEWSYKLLEEKDISSRHAVVAADINNDGWIDLVLVSREGEVCLALNKHI